MTSQKSVIPRLLTQDAVNAKLVTGRIDLLRGEVGEEVITLPSCVNDRGGIETIVMNEGLSLIGFDDMHDIIVESIEEKKGEGAVLFDDMMGRGIEDIISQRTKIANILTNIKLQLTRNNFIFIITYDLNRGNFTWYLTNIIEGKRVVVCNLRWSVHSVSSDNLGLNSKTSLKKERDVICGNVLWVSVYPCAKGMSLAYLIELSAMCVAGIAGIQFWVKDNDTDNAFSHIEGESKDYNSSLKYLKYDRLALNLISGHEPTYISGSDTASDTYTEHSELPDVSSQFDSDPDLLHGSSQTMGRDYQSFMTEIDHAISTIISDIFKTKIKEPIFNKVLSAILKNDDVLGMTLENAMAIMNEFVDSIITDEVKANLLSQLELTLTPSSEISKNDIEKIINERIEHYKKYLPAETLSASGLQYMYQHESNGVTSRFHEVLDDFSPDGTSEKLSNIFPKLTRFIEKTHSSKAGGSRNKRTKKSIRRSKKNKKSRKTKKSRK